MESYFERRLHLVLPIDCMLYYRNVGETREWRPKESFTEEERENWGSEQDAQDIADNIVGQWFGFSNGSSIHPTGIIESCQHAELTVTLDWEECRYTRSSLVAACEILCGMFDRGESFYADPSYIRNRSGNSSYNDPQRVHCDFDVPEQVESVLRKRRLRKTPA